MTSQITYPLFSLNRGPAAEILVHGAFATKIEGQDVRSRGPFSVLSKSLLSPWQFLACKTSGSESFWSIGFAFHSGQEIHFNALSEIARQAHAGEKELFCPREYPLDWEQVAKLKFAGKRPLRMHHPSSGKHLLMLAACEAHGYQKDGYWEQSHPLQKQIYALVGKEAREPIQWTFDNCGLPTCYISQKASLRMWERLATDTNSNTKTLRRLWLENPRLVGGNRRLDTELTIALEGRALVIEGEDGLLIVQSLKTDHEPVAACMIKIASGYNKAYLGIALLCAFSSRSDLPSVFSDLKRILEAKLDDWLQAGQSLTEYTRVNE